MKKTTLYTLLCTTIIASNVSMAAEQTEGQAEARGLPGTPQQPQRVSHLREEGTAPKMGTPIGDAAKRDKSEFDKALKVTHGTPVLLKTQEKAYRGNPLLSAGEQEDFINEGLDEARAKREEDREKKHEEIDRDAKIARQKRTLDLERITREKEDKRKLELALQAESTASESNRALIESNRKLKERADLLDGEISKLQIEYDTAVATKDSALEHKRLTAEQLAEKKRIIAEKRQELSAMQKELSAKAAENSDLQDKLALEKASRERFEQFVTSKIPSEMLSGSSPLSLLPPQLSGTLELQPSSVSSSTGVVSSDDSASTGALAAAVVTNGGGMPPSGTAIGDGSASSAAEKKGSADDEEMPNDGL